MIFFGDVFAGKERKTVSNSEKRLIYYEKPERLLEKSQ